MSRQQAFEAIYAKQHDVPAESLVRYRFKFKDGYNLPRISSHYRTYCDTLDSIVIDWPCTYENDRGVDSIYEDELKAAVTAAGVKYK